MSMQAKERHIILILSVRRTSLSWPISPDGCGSIKLSFLEVPVTYILPSTAACIESRSAFESIHCGSLCYSFAALGHCGGLPRTHLSLLESGSDRMPLLAAAGHAWRRPCRPPLAVTACLPVTHVRESEGPTVAKAELEGVLAQGRFRN